MRALLDTPVLVWAVLTPERLTVRAKALIQGDPSGLAVSAISAYEIELKRDRDPLLARMPENLLHALTGAGFNCWEVSAEHALQAGRLPCHHGDPLDRILIAQAMAASVPVISRDRHFKDYHGLTVVW